MGLSLDIPVWRILPAALADAPTTPARAPVGRFHHSGQTGAYASLSPEGAAIAIDRYLSEPMARVLVPMRLICQQVVDNRGCRDAAVVWQDIHARGAPSPTWAFSDAARRQGAEAMLYSSRSRPDLSHVVVFRPDCLKLVGPITPFV